MTQYDYELLSGLEESLQHHGIKGQRWGVTNGPPYPLSLKEHMAVLKKHREARQEENRIKKKNKVAKTMDVDKIYRNRNLFTNQELEDAITRAKLEQRVKIEANNRRVEKREKLDKVEAFIGIGPGAKKKKLIEKGNVAQIYKNSELFTTNELNDIINRINTDKRLKDLKPSLAKDVTSKILTGVGLIEAANKLTGIVNAVSGEDILPHYTLKDNKNKDNKKSDDGSNDNSDDSASEYNSTSKNKKKKNNNKNQTSNKVLDDAKEAIEAADKAIEKASGITIASLSDMYTNATPAPWHSDAYDTFEPATNIFGKAKYSTVTIDDIKKYLK